MTTVGNINDFINEFAPPDLAEDWDNVGLLVGDPQQSVKRVMTCLTITPESSDEATSGNADVIVSHHPLPFRSFKRLTTDQVAGRLLLDLIKAGVSIISPHTRFDSAANGINYQLAEKFGLTNVRPLVPSHENPELGAARIGEPADGGSLNDMIDRTRDVFGMPHVRYVGDLQQAAKRVAVCCGSGGSFLSRAIDAGCDVLITGETTYHTCLDARSNSVGMILLGHHNSERFALESLAGTLQSKFPDLKVWASKDESDPVQVA